DVRTLAFVRSRRGAETVALSARAKLSDVAFSLTPYSAASVHPTRHHAETGHRAPADDTSSGIAEPSHLDGSPRRDTPMDSPAPSAEIGDSDAAMASPAPTAEIQDSSAGSPSCPSDASPTENPLGWKFSDAEGADLAKLPDKIAAYRAGYLAED